MKILITGATGFVGKTLVPYIYSRGFTEIALLVRNRDKATLLFPDINLTIIDIQPDKGWRDEVIEYDADIVLHMATLFNLGADADIAEKIIETNILFTTLLLEAISHTSCTHFINIGTFTEFLLSDGDFCANNLYSATKTAARPIIQFYQTQSNFKWINVVVYSPYGRINEQKKVIDHMISAMSATTAVNFSKGEQILDFIHVDDMADFFNTLFLHIYDLQDDYIEFHLGTGKAESIRDVARVMEQVWGKKINANWGGIPYRKLDNMHAVAPISTNIELLNWRAKISLKEGLKILRDQMEQI